MDRPPRPAISGDTPSGSTELVDDAAEEPVELLNESRTGIVPVGQHGERLDKVLVTLAPEFSRSHLQTLVEGGHVQVDGAPAPVSSRRLRSGQRVVIELVPTEESLAFRAQALPLDILFEDDHLLVLHKPAGLVVHPAAGNWSGTLLNALLAHHGGASRLPRAGIVHRLDKDTSGVMMVGKSLQAVTALTRDIAARSVHRRYLALAHGVPAASLTRIDAPIARDPAVRVRMAIVAGGKPAQTDVELVAQRLGFSALRCTLHTGRTHQIRVHLSSRGLPLVADAVYGGKPALGMARQALHAVRLELKHPLTGQALCFDCEPPQDFAAAWQQVAGSGA